MTTHRLKTEQPYFDAIAGRQKTFEVRRNDRAFQTGDTLVLLEFAPEKCRLGHGQHELTPGEEKRCPAYTGKRQARRVTYVYSGDPRFGGIEPGYVVLGLEWMLDLTGGEQS